MQQYSDLSNLLLHISSLYSHIVNLQKGVCARASVGRGRLCLAHPGDGVKALISNLLRNKYIWRKQARGVYTKHFDCDLILHHSGARNAERS